MPDDFATRIRSLRGQLTDLDGYVSLKSEAGAALDAMAKGFGSGSALAKAVRREGGFPDTTLGRELLTLATDYERARRGPAR